ncbi:MAG: UdgX family uracil-DNA binding protein [Candidatus Rokuibacteriota bacterium]
MRTVAIAPTFEAWQAAARTLLRDGVPPAAVAWQERDVSAAAGAETGPRAHVPSVARVPRQFLDLARQAASAPDPGRWTALYEALWRIVNERHDLLHGTRDPAVRRLNALAAQGRREAQRAEAAEALALEAAGGAERFVPAGAGLDGLREAAARCTGCDLYRHATQTVFGRGPAGARVALVGEQPGDQEDLEGAPFVGPAGGVLDRALAEAGLDREHVYVTNAVKHFKFVPRGKRRIHQTPRLPEIAACRPWLEAELDAVRPAVLACLGATAARAIMGPAFRLMQQRGRFFATRWAAKTLATLHPSAVLRGQDEAEQARLYAMLRDDLRLVAAA